MANSALVEIDVQAGQKVLTALDDAEIDVAFCMWAKLTDYEDWRLVLAAPAFDRQGLLDAYISAELAIQGKFVFSRPAILIVSMSDEMVVGLQQIFGSANDVFGVRLGGQSFGRHTIEDAFIYRIKR